MFLFRTVIPICGSVPPDAPYALSRVNTWYRVIGRLRAFDRGASAGKSCNGREQLGKQYPKPDAELMAEIQPLKETTVGVARKSLWMLFGSVSLLLLIACTNIVALLWRAPLAST